MKIIWVNKLTKQGDWHFYDVEGDVYEVEKPDDFDCSVCAARSTSSKETIRMIIPFSQLKIIKDNPHYFEEIK